MAEGPENISLYPVIRKISGPAPLPVPESTTSGSVDVPESKNKDGNGNKRKIEKQPMITSYLKIIDQKLTISVISKISSPLWLMKKFFSMEFLECCLR